MQAANDEQFKHEFDNLMMLNHPNIVRLVGYCYDTKRQHVDFQGKIVFGETTYRALCFEYMRMGSLQRHLSGMMLFHLKYATIHHVTRKWLSTAATHQLSLYFLNVQMNLMDLTGTHVTKLSRGHVRD
jgi:hypothetical protein